MAIGFEDFDKRRVEIESRKQNLIKVKKSPKQWAIFLFLT